MGHFPGKTKHMETTQDTFNTVGEVIGAETNRKLDELVASRPQLAGFGSNAMNSVKDCALIADQYIRENSWKAVVTGAALGFVVGIFLSRDKRRM